MRRRTFIAGSALASFTTAATAVEIGTDTGSLRFPRDFLWGVSTSSFQIEGALNEDGRGRSIWDEAVEADPALAGPALDHYRRWPEDVALLQRLGVRTYRFSVAWPRVLPEGSGAVNPYGLDFYDRLVDRLLAAGITPIVCLYHWDLPAQLQQNGGWLDRAIVEHFARYARIVAARLGDRVRYWIPVNEALSVAFGGYGIGFYPPRIRGESEYFAAAHHLNLAQGAAFRELAAAGRQLGTAMCLYPIHPATTDHADVAAAQFHAAMSTKLFLDPLLRGRYPALVEDRIAPHLRPGDIEMIHHPAAFVGVNYYMPEYRRAAPEAPFGSVRVQPEGVAETGNGWLIEPQGLYSQLLELRDDYGNPPVFVTENGAAFDDRPEGSSHIADERRIAFLRAHLAAAHRALGEGSNLRGYLIWSLLDNYEWLVGFKSRFGLVYVDLATGERMPKSSFEWYRRVIRAGALTTASAGNSKSFRTLRRPAAAG